jgi:transposase
VSTVGNGRDFKRAQLQRLAGVGARAIQLGRQGSAWGASPRRVTLPAQPAGAWEHERCCAAAKNKTSKQDPISRWARSLAERRGYWRAVVAIAAKNARMCWAVLQRGENFKIPA